MDAKRAVSAESRCKGRRVSEGKGVEGESKLYEVKVGAREVFLRLGVGK